MPEIFQPDDQLIDNHPGGHSMRMPEPGEDEFDALLSGAAKRVINQEPNGTVDDEPEDDTPKIDKPFGGPASAW